MLSKFFKFPFSSFKFFLLIICSDKARKDRDKIWGEYGFADGFSETHNWYAKTHLAIDEGPIVVMIENYRSGLIWKLFMNIPDVQNGLKKLGFKSPYLK